MSAFAWQVGLASGGRIAYPATNPADDRARMSKSKVAPAKPGRSFLAGSAEINAMIARTAPAVLALLKDGVVRPKSAIITALADQHPQEDVVRTLMRLAATHIIPQTMELGGKSANIVCEDADLDAAAEGAAMSTVLNKGEVCLAGSRLFVHEKVRDAFLEQLTRLLAGIRIGDPQAPETQLGAMASQMQMDKVLGYLDQGPREGARVLLGGGRAEVAGLSRGLFIEPTLFVDVERLGPRTTVTSDAVLFAALMSWLKLVTVAVFVTLGKAAPLAATVSAIGGNELPGSSSGGCVHVTVCPEAPQLQPVPTPLTNVSPAVTPASWQASSISCR